MSLRCWAEEMRFGAGSAKLPAFSRLEPSEYPVSRGKPPLPGAVRLRDTGAPGARAEGRESWPALVSSPPRLEAGSLYPGHLETWLAWERSYFSARCQDLEGDG